MTHCRTSNPVRGVVPPTPWWSCPRPNPAAPLRLWCLPFVGAGAAIWHPWAARLGSTAEIMAARLPARETRLAESPLTRMTAVVDALVVDIIQFASDDYVLCGHSLGGLVAFELARRLRALKVPQPKALILCGTRAPHIPRPEPPLHQLTAREFLPEIEHRYGAIPPEIREHPEFLELLIPSLRADMEIYETYRYAPATRLDLPLLALGGTRDRIVSRSDVLGWRTHTTGRCETAFINSGHFFPQDAVDEVVPVVSTFLESLLVAR